MGYHVLCIGSAVVDNFLSVEPKFKTIKLGDKVLATAKEVHSGGGATNAAAALVTLGLKARVLTKLGDDHDANFIEKELKQYKIKNICRNYSKHNTDTATIVSSPKEKDRVIFVNKGASLDLSKSDFKKRDLNTKWVYLASAMGKSFTTAQTIIKTCKRQKVLFNPSLYLAKKGKYKLRSILSKTTIIVLNLEEAQALLQIKSTNPRALLKGLHKTGPQIVIITNGTKKLHASDGKTMYSFTPPNVKRVHTAGAGDSFTAGFLAGIIKKYSISGALRLGQVNSSSVIQHIGTKNKLLNEKEAMKWIKRFNLKIKETKL